MELDLLALRPANTPEHMTPAWLSCMRWAIGEPTIYAAFEKETGIRWKPPRSVIDRMVDDATGAGVQTIEAFVRWANDNVWGQIDSGDSPRDPREP